MAEKEVVYAAEARRKVMEGANLLADAVQVTLGPKGRNVLLMRSFERGIRVTKDGVTVAKEVEPEGKFENMGARLLRSVAMKTSDEAGDGTTTATVIGRTIAVEGMKAVAAGMNPMDIKRGVDVAVKAVVDELRRNAKPLEGEKEIVQVATVSANHDKEIGETVGATLSKLGEDGLLTVEHGKGAETVVDYVEGMKFDRGYLSPYFVTDREKMVCELEDVLVLLHEQKIASMRALVPLLEQVVRGKKPLLILAEDVESEPLSVLVANNLRGGFKCVAVKTPGFGDRRKHILKDIAILTGGEVISEELGVKVEKATIKSLGRVKKVRVDHESTMIIGGGGSKTAIAARCEELRKEIAETTASYDKEKLQQRLAHLAAGIAVIKVGGATESEVKEKKQRYDDAFNATRAAMEEGVVAGGGAALLHAQRALARLKSKNRDEEVGIAIVRKALETPAFLIAANGGEEGALVVGRIKEGPAPNYGYDALTGKYGDMIKSGIVDPLKVVRRALEDAGSVAGLLITTEAMITEAPQPPKPLVAPPGGRPGRMGGPMGM